MFVAKTMPVTATGVAIEYAGSAYAEPGRITRSGAGFVEAGPIRSVQPLLKPGATRLISSMRVGPFSLSQRSPLSGSNARPSELRMPYA